MVCFRYMMVNTLPKGDKYNNNNNNNRKYLTALFSAPLLHVMATSTSPTTLHLSHIILTISTVRMSAVILKIRKWLRRECVSTFRIYLAPGSLSLVSRWVKRPVLRSVCFTFREITWYKCTSKGRWVPGRCSFETKINLNFSEGQIVPRSQRTPSRS